MASIVQQSTGLIVTGDNSSEVIATWNVTAGNALVCITHSDVATAATHAVSDDVDGAWTTLVTAQANFRRVSISYILDHSGGATVGITSSSSSDMVKRNKLIEVSGVDQLDASGSYDDQTNQTTHYATAAGGVTVAADAFVCVGIQHNASANAHTPKTGWTEFDYDSGFQSGQYRLPTSQLTAERGEMTSQTGRYTAGVLLSLAPAAGGGADPRGPLHGLLIGSLGGRI